MRLGKTMLLGKSYGPQRRGEDSLNEIAGCKDNLGAPTTNVRI